MIYPTEDDIGRMVVYREAGTHEGRKVEKGLLTSFNERYAFVLYRGCTSAATSFDDLEWAICDDAEVMRIWRECDLPEYFLGNGGTNHKLVAFAERIRQPIKTERRPFVFKHGAELP